MNKKIFGAIDTPSIDYVIPRWEMIQSKLYNEQKLKRASVIYDDILFYLNAANLPGSKFMVDKETATICRTLVHELEELVKESDITIRHAGGTGYRKLFYTKYLLKNDVDVRLFGATGNDATGKKLRKMIDKHDVKLVDNKETLPFTRESLLITPKFSKDRIGAKFPYKEAEFFHDEKKLMEYAKTCEVLYLESSLIKFLGKDKFIEFCKNVAASGVKVIYAPPTDRSFFIGKDGRPLSDNLAAFRHCARYASIITMNELEAVWYMDDVNFYENITGRKDATFTKTISSIQKLVNNYDNKLVLVTAGEHGMVAVGNNMIIEKDAKKVERIINTVGAGDSAAAAFVSSLCEGNFAVNKTSVEKALSTASEISAFVIENQPA